MDPTPASFMTLFLRVAVELRIECLFLEFVDLLGRYRFDFDPYSPSEALGVWSSIYGPGSDICMSRSSFDQ
jgi:hypothetical protein